jgi:predicted MPP superfamily phosphohydrolase
MPVFHLLSLLLWLFVVLRFLIPLSWNPAATLFFALVMLVGSQHHYLSRRLFGSTFSPEMPRPLGIVANVLFGTLLLIATFQAALDILVLVSSLLTGSELAPPILARYLVGISALALSMLGVSQAVRVPPVKELEIGIPNLPAQFDGYRMIQLTDLHLSRLFSAPWAKEVVARANLQDVDLIVVTGDLMDGTLEARKDDVEPLGTLQAKDGVFVIPGNHEYYFGYEGWMSKYQQLGMTRLANSHVLLSRGSSTVVLAGITDSASGRFGLPKPDVRRALMGAPSGAPVILLAHQPKGAPEAAEAGVALQLSGHTHGGMVLGLDRLVARFNNGFVSGFYDVGGMQLYVNNGTALWNGFALRIGVPSELTVITLRGR